MDIGKGLVYGFSSGVSITSKAPFRSSGMPVGLRSNIIICGLASTLDYEFGYERVP